MVPISALYEGHLTVTDLARSIAFYRDVLGLELAHEIPSRGVAFFWLGGRETSMLGLWSTGSAPVRLRSHVAFKVTLDGLLGSIDALRRRGVVPLRRGGGAETDEPVVFPWMPAASVYFDDPDGNALEYISLLPHPPRPDVGAAVTLSDWMRLQANPDPRTGR